MRSNKLESTVARSTLLTLPDWEKSWSHNCWKRAIKSDSWWIYVADVEL